MAWVFEDKFNSDTKSTGDLNGQDGWTGGTGTDVVTTSPYEGDQCVSLGNEASMVSSTFTAVTSGVVYFAVRATTLSGSGNVDFRVGTNIRVRFTMYDSGGFKTEISNGGGVTQVIDPLTSGNWFLVELTLYDDDTHDVRYHNGSTWSIPITGLAANTGGTGDVTNVRLNSGTTTVAYVDCITPTNPISGGSTPYRRRSNLALLGVS